MLKRLHISFSVLAAVVILMNTSCRRKVEEQPVFPSAEYYSPTQVAPSSQLEIHGAVLGSSDVYIGGKKAELDSVSADGRVIYVKVPSSLEVGSEHIVKVVYNEKEEFEFISKIKIAATSSSVKELLIGDFDGGGIRSAIATSNFTNGQWSGNAGANSIIGITNNINGVEPSKAGGNFAYATVAGGGVLPNTYGFVATISSRSGLQNDLITEWPANFFKYPGSILDSTDKVITNYFVNFYLNFNNNPKSQVRVYIGSTKLPKEERYAKTIKPIGAANPVNGWYKVSLPLNQFKDGYGFGAAMKFNDFLKLNQIDFDISDSYENIYSDCCKNTITDCCATAIKDPVQVYIDQVVISQGGSAPSVQ